MDPLAKKRRIAHRPKSAMVLTHVEAIINRTKSKLCESGQTKSMHKGQKATENDPEESKLRKTPGTKSVKNFDVGGKVLVSGSVSTNKIMDNWTFQKKASSQITIKDVKIEEKCLRKRDRNFTYNENELQDRQYNKAYLVCPVPVSPKNPKLKIKIISRPPEDGLPLKKKKKPE